MFSSKVLISKILSTETKSIECVFSCKEKIYTFLNPVSYLDAQKYKGLFGQFDGIWADGSLLVSAIKMLYGKRVTRRSFDMTSIAPILFEYAEREKKTVYIVASKQEDVERAVEIFKIHYPNIVFSGYRNGYFHSETEIDAEIRNICEIQPDFLIVGMGIISQERFLLNVKKNGFNGIGFTCGGFIHQTAKNEIDYYPNWVDRMNIRFLYRMWHEPHTRKRYIKAGLIFPVSFLSERIFG